MATDIFRPIPNPANWDLAAYWSAELPGPTTATSLPYGVTLVTSPIAVASIQIGGLLVFENAGNSTVTGAVYIAATDSTQLGLNLDRYYLNDGGGSTLTIGGLLTNGGALNVSGDSVTAARLVNNGFITLLGSDATPGKLYLKSAVDTGYGAGVWHGDIELNGNALLEFNSGQITEIAQGAILTLAGAEARVADANDLTSNSALLGLSNNLGTLELDGGQIGTTGPLFNAGAITVGSSGEVTVGGAITNEGHVTLGRFANDGINILQASSFDNSQGYVALIGGSASISELELAGAASLGATLGILCGEVDVIEHSLIEFNGGGQITEIAAGAILQMVGDDAFIADAGHTASNSALWGLTAVNGTLNGIDGVSITTAGALSNAGIIYWDYGAEGGPGSDLSIGGAFANSGSLIMGPPVLSGTSTIRAASLDNAAGTIRVQGSAAAVSRFIVRGAAENTGVIDDEIGGYLAIAGDLSGSGTVNISDGGRLVVGAVGSDQTIAFGTGGGWLRVTADDNIGAHITGFGKGDAVDFSSLSYASTDVLAYAPNVGDTGGQVMIETSLGATLASFAVTGDYTQENFLLKGDASNQVVVWYQK